jgi:hypothetical protein
MLMKSAVVKRIDLWSLCKMAFVLYATLGFVCGLFYGAIIAFIGSFGAMWGEHMPGIGRLSGVIGIIAVPIIAVGYGCLGAIVMTIAGGLYNVAARFVGGVTLTVDVQDIAGPPSV